MDKKIILDTLHNFNDKYKDSGFEFISLFGSYARGTEDIFSDIDLTYKINYNKFYKDNAFAQLEKIQEIKKNLEKQFRKKIDLIPANTTNKIILSTLLEEQIMI